MSYNPVHTGRKLNVLKTFDLHPVSTWKSYSLAKWLSVRLRSKWFWVRVQLQSSYTVVVKND